MINHKIIRLCAVKEITGLSASTIWRHEREGIFPLRKSLGNRAVGWRYDEVMHWLEARESKQSEKFKL